MHEWHRLHSYCARGASERDCSRAVGAVVAVDSAVPLAVGADSAGLPTAGIEMVSFFCKDLASCKGSIRCSSNRLARYKAKRHVT